MRQSIQTILIVFCLGITAKTAVAQSVMHQWIITESSADATVLATQDSATGHNLTVTINPPIKLNDSDATSLFDAEIERQMAGINISHRDDELRISRSGTAMLVTSMEYETKSPTVKRIAMFAVYRVPDKNAKAGEEEIHVVRADGPPDRAIMARYSIDILSIAGHTQAAISGNLKLDPLSGDSKTQSPSTDTTLSTAKPARQATQPSKVLSQKPLSAPVPQDWSSKVYTDAVSYWPTVGPLARGSKTGYLSVLIYNELPLNNRPVRTVLSDFATSQEKHWNVRRKEIAINDGPHRAWDYLRAKNKNNVYLNVSYLAIRTGENTVRIIRETLTDDDHEERYSYLRAIEQLYQTIDNETPSQFRGDTPPATTMHIMTKKLQTESRKQRRERQKLTKAAHRKEHLAAVASRPGEGIQFNNIANVFLRSDFLTRAYGGKKADVAVYILLNDGTAYRNPTLPPSDINAAASRRLEASQWMQWRKSGTTYQVRPNSNTDWENLKGEIAKPSPSKTVGFKGKHIASWGDILSGTAGHRTGSILLTRPGRYETSSFALMGGSGITGLPAATVSSSTGKNGRQTTSMSNVAPALLNNTQHDPNGTDFTGQYALQGYTAEFLSDSGILSRKLFLMTQEGDMYVSGRFYTVPEKK